MVGIIDSSSSVSGSGRDDRNDSGIARNGRYGDIQW